MKRTILAALVLMLCLLAGMCSAEVERALPEEWTLPEDVRALCEAAHPDYRIVVYEGWGDETRGQIALILSREGHNILCVAEKAEGDAAYALTVDNDRALHGGVLLPTLLIDTDGDSLFYTYQEGKSRTTRYHSAKENGVWGAVDVTFLDTTMDAYDEEKRAYVSDGYLYFTCRRQDKQENPLPGGYDLVPVPVSKAYTDRLRLATFDSYALTPSMGLVRAAEGLCDGLIQAGDTLLEVSVQQQSIIMLVQEADGTRRIRFADEEYDIIEIGPTPSNASLDTFHMWEGKLFLISDDGYHNFVRARDGKWYLSGVQTEELFGVCYDGIEDVEKAPGLGRNDGVTYGVSPWSADITQLDLCALPRTLEEALSQLDPSRYAFVNTPDPADRLPLREKPEEDATSLGRFYNRTPVYILEERGEWAHVRIGREASGLTGWMLKKHLAYGGDREDVVCAFPQLSVREDLGYTVPLCDGPDEFYVIGTRGDDRLIIMTEDGTVGDVRSSDLWEGNG